MNAPGWFRFTLVAGALAVLCLTGGATAQKPLNAQERDAIYRRAETVFDQAALFKPAEPTSVGNIAVKLAPLFICELASTNAAEAQPASLREVSFFEGEVVVGGKAHRQVSFVWKRPGSKRRGVRITLNLAGLPVIWEVLDISTRAQVVFVSQNLDAAATREFGTSLPGRRFAVERAVGETPDVVVARVNDEAPVAMGPIVHLDGRGKITTVNCRCMTTQARHLVGTANYELKLLSAPTNGKREILGTNCGIGEKLRLPPAF